jgi:hypothetical protein
MAGNDLQSLKTPPQKAPSRHPMKAGRFRRPIPTVVKLYGGPAKYVVSVVASIENQARIEPYCRAEYATAGKVNKIMKGW